MEITIFTELTTKEHLEQLKTESEKYTGLYVDMNNAKERKYVKDKAESINQLLKKVERKRIDASKEYKIRVETEAADIKERLEIANLPFTLLIDEYKAERKKILDAEKAERDARELAAKIEADHEFALLMNDKFDVDKVEEKRKKKEHEDQLKQEAAAEAKAIAEAIAKENEQRIEKEKQAAIDREVAAKQAQEKAERDAVEAQEREKQNKIDAEKHAKLVAEQAEKKRIEDIESARQSEVFRQREESRIEKEAAEKREANKRHNAKINNGILKVLLDNGISENDAKTVVKLAAKRELPNLVINY